jgi:hypothetical protein
LILLFRNECGGRVLILSDIYDFFKVAISPVIDQGYGLTKTFTDLAVQEYLDDDSMVLEQFPSHLSLNFEEFWI